jgi:hypothetical protein
MIFTNLLTNMVVLGMASVIQTNTPKFQGYALHEMFASATNMVARWNLDLPNPITTNIVTDFSEVAYPSGLGGSITFNNRYFFSWLYGGNPHFNDQTYSCLRTLTPDVDSNDAVLEQWMHATNLLTMITAQQIAESAMKSLGLPLDKLGFKKPAQAHQRKYQWKDGKLYPLPYYQFRWEAEKAACTVDISGIIGKAVYFDYTDFRAIYLRLPKPTNYLEMLGLPTNAIFVYRYFTPHGQPQRYELRQP